jgi:VanZ family protein
VTIRAGIAVYWIVMFLATHLPVQRVMEQLPASDKHLHLGAYAVLGFALPWWSAKHWRSRWPPVWLYGLILGYAGIDELLQIPVGRSAEWGDWLADAAGAAIGLAVANWLRGG